MGSKVAIRVESADSREIGMSRTPGRSAGAFSGKV
ncbi:hypothetical protein DFO46_0859 [Rhizobium sp. AG855]|nr:hypothetical protein DFO46_0859 [Rhizobium sp. AG855]